MDKLNKIYVEPTTHCNLSCVTCIRHSWDEPFGVMDWPVYQALVDGLQDFPEAKTIAFAGFGEPLLHKRFPEMIRLANERGLRIESERNIAPRPPLKIGIEFVAMKSNIHELPAIQEIAAKIQASFIIVSNLLPYTAEMQDQILYNLEATSYEGQGWAHNPLWMLPKMDWNRETQGPLTTIFYHDQ